MIEQNMQKNLPSKKKNPRVIERGRIYIQSTFNNTIISITDDLGGVLVWTSAGTLGFKGARKATPYAAQIAAQTVLDKAEKMGINTLGIYVSGVGPGRESAIRTLYKYNFNVSQIKDITPLPHNGCRPKKPRRV